MVVVVYNLGDWVEGGGSLSAGAARTKAVTSCSRLRFPAGAHRTLSLRLSSEWSAWTGRPSAAGRCPTRLWAYRSPFTMSFLCAGPRQRIPSIHTGASRPRTRAAKT